MRLVSISRNIQTSCSSAPMVAVVLAVVTVLLGCSSSDTSQPIVQNPDISTVSYDLPIAIDGSYDTSAITALLSTQDAIDAAGGGMALILVKDGQLVYRRGFGSFERAVDKVVPIASGSKWISAGVVASLVDAGMFGLDDPVTAYYPYFDGVTPPPNWVPPPNDFVYDPRLQDITIAQLFSHTAGLDYLPDFHRRPKLPSIQFTVLQIYYNVPVIFDPGSTLLYAGVGMQVVGGIAELVDNKPWMQVFTDRLATSLGMEQTDYYGYVPDPVFTDNPDIGGSIRTNVDDYMRYLYMIYNNGLFDGKRVLSEAAVRAITTSYSAGLPVERSPFESYYDVAPETMLLETGLGNWLLEDQNGNTRYVISGGAWGCMPFIDYERDLVGVYLPYNTSAVADPDTTVNPATVLFLRDLKPLLEQTFVN